MKLSLLITSFFILFTCSAQQLKQYDKEFEFKEGIYLNFHQFRRNNPIERSQIVSEFNKTEMDFLKQVVQLKTINYIDSIGVKRTVNTVELWGYSNNNTVYINYKDDFNRVPFIGSLCHFTAMVTYYTRYRDPYMYGGMGTAMTLPSKQMEQFIIDTDSGVIYSFSVETIEFLLQKDAVLLAEFQVLKRKKKRDSVFLYLRKYNEKHPLMFKVW